MKFNVLDIEAYHKDKFVAYCACVLIRGRMKIFYGYDVVNKLIKWCEGANLKETIYCHNLTFDGGIILSEIALGYEINGFWFRSSIYELTIKNTKFEIRFRCSYKILPMSLEKIGVLLGDDNKKLELDHTNVNEENIFEIKEKAIRYCAMDVKITCNFLEKIKEEFIGDIDIMLKARSISSFSIATYAKIYNKKKVNMEISRYEDELIRKAYYGGRCEVFGNPYEFEKIFHYDFTGMYSQVMREQFCFGKAVKTAAKDTNAPGFYNVRIESKIDHIPVLPVRNEDNGKLLFPNGGWSGTYWWEEIQYFKKMGGSVKKINYKIQLERYDTIFEDFVETHAAFRKKSKLGNTFWKLFVNSISGRLGMGEILTKDVIIKSAQEYEKIKNERTIVKEKWVNSIAIITYEDESDRNTIKSNVAVAAAITSKARIKLHKAYVDVIKNGGRILYSDTDSVFAAFKKDVTNQLHGEVFWDGNKTDTKIKDAVFAIPKGYAVIFENGKEETKLKGFKKNSISFKEFKAAFENDAEIRKWEEQFKKDKIVPNLVKIEKKTRLGHYDKRIFSEGKKETKPLILAKK